MSIYDRTPEELREEIEHLQSIISSLLMNYVDVLYEIPQQNSYRYQLNTSIDTTFKGVLTFIPNHFSKNPTTISTSTSLLLQHSDGTTDECALMTVDTQGLRRHLMEGDIIANRPCQIVFISPSIAVVINPATVFIAKANNIESVFQHSNLAEDIESLKDALESVKTDFEREIPKIIVGVGEPEEALKDSSDNTIYFRIEEGL